MSSILINYLGLDVGDRRIGVAIANNQAKLASPLITLDRLKEDDIVSSIKKIANDNNIKMVIVGLPRGMSGQETEQTIKNRQFAGLVEKALKMPVYLQDEAGTSLKAKDELSLKNKNYQKSDVDKLAATYILQDWIDNTWRDN